MDEFWVLIEASDAAGTPDERLAWLTDRPAEPARRFPRPAALFPLPREDRRPVWETARP